MSRSTRPGSEPEPGPWDVFKVFELINSNADPERITCVYEWHDSDGTPVRCDKDIDEDRQIRAWKELLDLPWGSVDSSQWRAALGDAARLLSCGRHDKGKDVQTVTMGWASQAKLHANKARGDQLVLRYGESAKSKVIEGIRAPRPRSATTASNPRVLNGMRRTSSGYNTASRHFPIAPDASAPAKSIRKDSAWDSVLSRTERSTESFQTCNEVPHDEPEMFQLDEDVQALHDALWSDSQAVRPATSAGPRRLRARSEPDVHMNENQLTSNHARANSASILFRSSRNRQGEPGSIVASDVQRTSPTEEMFEGERVKVGQSELETSIQREHEPGPHVRSLFNDSRRSQWVLDTKLRQQTYAGDKEAQLSPENVARQRRRDQERLEEEIRAHVEQERDQHGSFVSKPAVADFEVIQSSWSTYMRGWMELLKLDDDCTGAELFATLPRPVLGADLRTKYATELSTGLEYDVSNFYRNMPRGENFERSEIRKQLKLEVARIHPDKIRQRFPAAGGDDRVVELTTRVTQVLTILIALV
ncbi:hypothetical protein CERZMDRAFT_94943 [Cercospora zeae-maydis SCOH1-5]|uniref:J domain-containing protein n=1 Tax=Cercospora zeae-maydis SCOH1-5 TaxID=717836 RepID=A0A6A6FQ36_9PEZI|nr:hypothetical protein CERZMDRAFT_94943 [Cercospora zeae-maydis SCOH1-5]